MLFYCVALEEMQHLCIGDKVSTNHFYWKLQCKDIATTDLTTTPHTNFLASRNRQCQTMFLNISRKQFRAGKILQRLPGTFKHIIV